MDPWNIIGWALLSVAGLALAKLLWTLGKGAHAFATLWWMSRSSRRKHPPEQGQQWMAPNWKNPDSPHRYLIRSVCGDQAQISWSSGAFRASISVDWADWSQRRMVVLTKHADGTDA
jgi:hypothetical protein